MFYALIALLFLFIYFIYYIQYILVYPGSLLKDNCHFITSARKMEILENDGHNSYYLRPVDESKEGKLWIFFTGNNMTAKTYYKIARKIQKQKNNIHDTMLLFEYPSYGINNGSGILSVYTINMYIKQCINLLKEKFLFNKVNLFAWSLGCAIALRFAEVNKVNKVYLLSPFTTFQDAISNVIGYIPLHHLLEYSSRWDNLECIVNVKAKKIEIFHGTEDKTVPFEHGMQLFDNIPRKVHKIFTKFDGSDHNIFKLINYELL
jgi:pimeloyl-ACP methyl ester carboxylesterase